MCIRDRICTYIFDWTLSTVLWHSTPVRGDFIVSRSNRQFSNSSFPLLHHHLGIASLHTFAPHPHTHFLTRLKTHLFAESLLWHCDAVVFSFYFWRPRALDVGRHSKFMLIDWLKYIAMVSLYGRRSTFQRPIGQYWQNNSQTNLLILWSQTNVMTRFTEWFTERICHVGLILQLTERSVKAAK